MKFAPIVPVLALSVVGVAHAQSVLAPPTEINVPDGFEPGLTQNQPVRGVTIGDFQVTFEKTTLKQARAALGAIPIGHRGDAGGSLYWICYTIPAIQSRVWLLSNEIGGGEDITGMIAKPVSPTEVENLKCPTPTNHATTVFIDKKIWLGDSIGKIESVLGKSVKFSESIRYYWYSGEAKNGFTVESSLFMRLDGDKVTELQATHISTN